MFEGRLATVDVLSEGSLDVLDRGWRRLVSEIGLQIDHAPSLELLRQAGQEVEGDVVRFDPDFVLEQVARTPTTFGLRGRDPARSITFEPGRSVFCPVQSAPFVREGGERRVATMEDFRRLVRLVHVTPELDTPGYPVCEPGDLEPDVRHLHLQLALATETDKPYGAAQFDAVGCRDSIEMAAIVHGRAAIEETPALFGVVNVNSPLRYDERMLGSLWELARAGQIVVVTPFILMGAMGPVSTPGALAQQLAESLTGIALVQLVRPGCPAILGSFVSHTDMQSGSPGFGGPESAVGLLASGQLARRYGLLWRSGGGGLTSSPVVDAQAAFEALNTMMPAMLAGANLVLHAAGWLESGLVASYEKLMVDVEALRILQQELRPVEIVDADLAFEAHAEVRHGGHFFGAAHTLERYRDCFYRPLVFTTENHDRWERNGRLDAAARASRRWREALERYEQPPLDAALLGELEEYVARREREIVAER